MIWIKPLVLGIASLQLSGTASAIPNRESGDSNRATPKARLNIDKLQFGLVLRLGLPATGLRKPKSPKSAGKSAGKRRIAGGTAGNNAGRTVFSGQAEERHCSQQSALNPASQRSASFSCHVEYVEYFGYYRANSQPIVPKKNLTYSSYAT